MSAIPPIPDPIFAPAAVTLAVLAGGEGVRMGMPKGLLSIQGQPILEYLLDRLAFPGPTLLVTAPGRERPPGWRRFSGEVSDPVSGGGPLRGVLTALEHLATPLLLVLTVDMPGIRPTHLQWTLHEITRRPETLGLMTRRNMDGEPRVEPFPSVFRAQARATIASRLSQNRRSVHGLLDEPGFEAVRAPAEWDEKAWVNLNSPADVRKAAAGSWPIARPRSPADR
ncbi:MAG TPA: molybdenum cofactor guanylyltransferase [Tepidisphaeraceae bacterium]|nr:molybdenum cofactor guanylyltransferase [Tepidisphaeraceae bacterium]